MLQHVPLFNNKADKLTSYLKSEVENNFSVVDNWIINNYFTKAQIHHLFELSSDLNSQATLITNNTYAIPDVNTQLINEADKSNSYTEEEIITLVETQYTFNGSF